MDIYAKISGIKYDPIMCKKLTEYSFDTLTHDLPEDATFILNLGGKRKIAVSKWVSAKRTRSYPYARVYDSLAFIGKKATIIPIYKDEGKDGDRDYLQWDTISLMSLLNVNVIIAYYKYATKNPKYQNKITNQKFDIEHVKNQIEQLISYQSDALHWNMGQIDNLLSMGKVAIDSYESISSKTGVEMHSKKDAINRIQDIMSEKESFMKSSREFALQAQKRESLTVQPKENVNGTKGTITITNYYGGNYYFTADEVEIDRDSIYLVEAKNTNSCKLPSLSDIKDGLLKMILFTNLDNVFVDGTSYKPIPVLKLTNNAESTHRLLKQNATLYEEMKSEATKNGFKLLLDKQYLF